MTDRPWMRPNGVVLDSLDARALASFWERLTGWPRRSDEPNWVTLTAPDRYLGLSFQTEINYVPPVWPTVEGQRQMQLHLDIEVHDLDAAVEYATSLGAQLAGYQPQDLVRVMLDPAGHPFCFWVQQDQ